MSTLLASTTPFAGMQAAVPAARETSAATWRCLIVSDDSERREMLARAADQGGWAADVCRTAAEAQKQSRRFRHGLVIVDLDGGQADDARLRELGQELSPGDALLVVCGAEGDAMQEIWARGLGAWLYLPGVDASCDLSSLCGEALAIAEKLNPPLLATA
jgi:ActR/RegA family two-component response regulator